MSDYNLESLKNIPYRLAKCKTFRGHDGGGFECVVMMGKRNLGYCVDDGWGGGIDFQEWKQADLDAFQSFAKSLPNYPPCDLFPNGMTMDAACLVGELCEAQEQSKLREKNRKRFEKYCASAMLFRLKDTKPHAWHQIPLSQGTFDSIHAFVIRKHGADVVILNDLMVSDPYAWERF